MFLYTSVLVFSSHIFSWEGFFWWERFFFPWVHWSCTLNNFWCHWLSFRLAHPNTRFAVYLVLSIRPVVYGIWLHADIASYCCIVLAPVIHTLPAPSCCLAQAPHVAWPKPMACQLLSACCTSNESTDQLLVFCAEWLTENEPGTHSRETSLRMSQVLTQGRPLQYLP